MKETGGEKKRKIEQSRQFASEIIYQNKSDEANIDEDKKELKSKYMNSYVCT